MSNGPWPTPTYAARRALKAERRSRCTVRQTPPTATHIVPNAAQRLVASYFASGELARKHQDKIKFAKQLRAARRRGHVA